jgi:hypothetical protein
MLKLKFGHIAMIFGGTGIALLYVVTVLSQPVQIANFDELSHHEGQQVSVEGTVLSYKTTETDELIITVYNEQKTLDIFLENNVDKQKKLQINTMISATGEVQLNYRGKYELVVTDNKNMNIIGEYRPPDLNLTYPEIHNNSYVAMSGTVLGLEDYYGDALKLLVRNGSARMEIIAYDPPSSLSIGDNIEADGIIRNTLAGFRLYSYSSDAIVKTGRWEFESTGLQELSANPESYLDFPVNIQCFVRVEPYTQPAYSFYISDSPVDSELKLRVELSELNEPLELHKGDTISMLTYTAFDTSTLRYFLTPVGLELIDNRGAWQVSIDELAENAFEYERALLNISGYLHYTDNNYMITDRNVLGNSSVYLPIQMPLNGSPGLMNMSAYISQTITTDYEAMPFDQSSSNKVSLHGRLVLNPRRFFYSFTLEPNPSDVFYGSRILDDSSNYSSSPN